MKKFRCRKGTSLLEVMVALAVASIALVSFVSLVFSSIEMEGQARKVTEATLIADGKMAEVERAGFPEIGTTEGLVDPNDAAGFSYRVSVTGTPIENVRQVLVEVSWDRKRRSVDLTSFIARRE